MSLGALKARGVRVSNKNVRIVLRSANGAQAALRRLRAVRRRVYDVPYPMMLWHSDGCHHLIRYGIVLHGCIDGNSRKIIWMRFENNNRASTVGALHRDAIQRFGVPTLHRTDHGGENKEIWEMINYMSGLGYRCKCIQGPSTGNQ